MGTHCNEKDIQKFNGLVELQLEHFELAKRIASDLKYASKHSRDKFEKFKEKMSPEQWNEILNSFEYESAKSQFDNK